MTEAVTEDELDTLFEAATHSIFRLETLPEYRVDEEADRIAAWREGRPRPEQSVRTSSWLAEIAGSTLGGVHWQRVRVLDDPPTWYQRYELQALAEMQAAGCSVRVARRDDVPATWRDGWLFDVGTDRAAGVGLVYSDTGRFAGLERWAPAGLLDVRDGALSVSAPLNEYLLRGDVCPMS